jgi:hypothetical protein
VSSSDALVVVVVVCAGYAILKSWTDGAMGAKGLIGVLVGAAVAVLWLFDHGGSTVFLNELQDNVNDGPVTTSPWLADP